MPIVDKRMHPKRVTVWWGLWAEGIIGPHIFENDAYVIANGARYHTMITGYLLLVISMTFDIQQNFETCHTARETMALLREQFG